MGWKMSLVCPEGSKGKRADAQIFKWSTKSTFIFNYVLLTQVIYGYVLLETLMIKLKCNFFHQLLAWSPFQTQVALLSVWGECFLIIVYTGVYKYVYMYVYTYAHICVYTQCMHLYMCICVHICICVHTCITVHTYIQVIFHAYFIDLTPVVYHSIHFDLQLAFPFLFFVVVVKFFFFFW